MRSFIGASLLGFVLACSAAAQDTAPAGHYEGVIQAPDREVNFSVDLASSAKGWIGHLSMTVGPREIPLKGITIQGDAIAFALGVPNGPAFEGKWDKEANTIRGTVTSPDGKGVPFELKRTGDAKVIEATASTPIAPEWVGTWEGTLEISGKSLRLQVNLKQGAEGKAEGTLVSLDQGAQSIPISTITQTGNSLTFEIRMMSGVFKGTMNEAKDTISGDWNQGGRTLPLTFKKAAAAK